MFKRIDHVEIITDQLDRTVQFYTDVLGFSVKTRDRIVANVFTWACDGGPANLARRAPIREWSGTPAREPCCSN